MIENHRNGIYASPSAGPDAAPTDIYARALSRPLAILEGKTRAHTAARARDRRHEIEGGWGLDLGFAPGRGRGEKPVVAARAGVRIATSPFFCCPKPSIPNFVEA
jgi:hypothetical protein